MNEGTLVIFKEGDDDYNESNRAEIKYFVQKMEEAALAFTNLKTRSDIFAKEELRKMWMEAMETYENLYKQCKQWLSKHPSETE